MRTIKTITFIYNPREDRIAAAINAGREDAWTCWLTRRLTLALLNRAPEYLTSTSEFAQRAPVELRSDVAAFERDAAIIQTARAMTQTPPAVLESSALTAELAERLTITVQKDGFRLELQGLSGETGIGILTRAEMQRTLQMLHDVAAKENWVFATSESSLARPNPAPNPTSSRH